MDCVKLWSSINMQYSQHHSHSFLAMLEMYDCSSCGYIQARGCALAPVPDSRAAPLNSRHPSDSYTYSS